MEHFEHCIKKTHTHNERCKHRQNSSFVLQYPETFHTIDLDLTSIQEHIGLHFYLGDYKKSKIFFVIQVAFVAFYSPKKNLKKKSGELESHEKGHS